MATHRTSRDRLIDAAKDLFYRNGIHRTGVESIADHAGLTKPTLYNLFVSKNGLVDAVLEKRAADGRAWIASRIDGIDDPTDRLEAIVDLHARALGSDGFRGCPLLVAAQELPITSNVSRVTRGYKTWLRGRIEGAAREAGLRDPGSFAWSLFLLIEGAASVSRVMSGRSVAARLRKSARALIDAHTPTPA